MELTGRRSVHWEPGYLAAFARYLGRSAGMTSMAFDLDLIFPIRDVASADLMMLKATCLWNAGIIDDGERELVQQRAERFLRRAKANAALWPSALHPSRPSASPRAA
jgi:hypothetical protein